MSDYRVLINYGAYEGHNFISDNKGKIVVFKTIDEAVKTAQKETYGHDWLIVKVISWKAKVEE